MSYRQNVVRRVAAWALVASMGSFTLPVMAQDIPWPRTLFERDYFDADIRAVLTTIINEAGLQSDFRPGVQGSVTFNFRNMPLQAAFNKLVEENNLTTNYDAATRTITISVPLPGRLITLSFASVEQVKQAARKLGIGGRIDDDPKTGVILVRGTTEQVTQLEDLAKRLDAAEKAFQDHKQSLAAAETVRGVEDAKREAEVAKRDLAKAEAEERRLKTEIHARMLDEVRNTDTKVIPIRYANVGPTTQTFQGQQVTIPGIDETLRTMLGITEAKGAGAAGAGTAPLSATEQQELARIRRELGQVPPVVSIDPRTNSVIVRGTPTAIAEVERLIARLDRPLPLLEIEVMIVRASRGVAEELGVRWGAARVQTHDGRAYGVGVTTGIDGKSLVPPLTSTATNVASTTASTVNNTTTVGIQETKIPIPPVNPFSLLPTSLGGTIAAFVYRGNNLSLQAQLDALSNAAKAQTIAAPRVVTLNNLEAKVTNDRTQYLPVPAAPNAPGGYQEVKAGLTLKIVPSLIQHEDSGEQSLVRLNINALDKDVTISPEGRPLLTGNEVQTQVVIPDGSTFVMGGLMNDVRYEGREAVPLLGDIPVLGALFSSRSSRSDLAETIFFITPHLVRPSDVFAQDVAQRRYLETQRAKLAEVRHDVQAKSQLLDLGSSMIEEDE